MRRLLMVLILAVCGCSDGGAGDAGTAGFRAPPPELPLIPGIYTGNVECLLTANLQSGTDSSLSADEISIPIGNAGLPDSGGSELEIGFASDFDLGFLAGTSTVTTLATDTGKVLIGSSIEAVGFFNNQPTAIVAGVGSVLYEQRPDGGIDYTLDILLGSSDAAETIFWDCEGVLRR